jgi:hypothetical protein
MELPQRVRGLPMQTHPVGRREFLIQSQADELVGEPELSQCGVDGFDQPRLSAAIQEVEHVGGCHVHHPPQCLGGKFRAQH